MMSMGEYLAECAHLASARAIRCKDTCAGSSPFRRRALPEYDNEWQEMFLFSTIIANKRNNSSWSCPLMRAMDH